MNSELPIQYPADFNSSRAERKVTKNSSVKSCFLLFEKFNETRVEKILLYIISELTGECVIMNHKSMY